MAGILDSKQRIMDVIITEEGRRQVATGELRIEFASFTDAHTFYEASGSAGDIASDASHRLFLEAFNRPQDQIVLETDDVGQLIPFKGGKVEMRGNKLFKPVSPSVKNPSGKRLEIMTGSASVTAADELLQNAYDNFTEQMIIGSADPFSDNNDFELALSQKDEDTGNPTFNITDNVPIAQNEITEANLLSVESLYEDMRLAHLPNYQYLPPINKKSPGDPDGTPLGDYPELNQEPVMTYQSLMGHLAGKESIDVYFSNTSRDNNIIAQMFDVRPNSIEKLDIIDFGEIPDDDPYSPGKQVFFLGKILNDDDDDPTFVNLFTLIFDVS